MWHKHKMKSMHDLITFTKLRKKKKKSKVYNVILIIKKIKERDYFNHTLKFFLKFINKKNLLLRTCPRNSLKIKKNSLSTYDFTTKNINH